MRVAVCDIQQPFADATAGHVGQSLVTALEQHGLDAELVTLPFESRSPCGVARSMLAWRLVDVMETMGRPIDRVIALRFPAYLVQHPNKTVWMVSQHGTAGELWPAQPEVPASPEGERISAMIHRSDDRALVNARAVLTNSQSVADRLRRFSGIVARPIHHPPPDAERLGPLRSDRYVLCPRPQVPLERAELLIEAMALTTSDALCIQIVDPVEEERLKQLVAARQLSGRVVIRSRVSRDDLVELYANARVVYYGPRREDYSDVPFEAFLSGKPVITLTDSEGPLEFVRNGVNGCVVPPFAGEIARAVDRLMDDQAGADRMGRLGPGAGGGTAIELAQRRGGAGRVRVAICDNQVPFVSGGAESLRRCLTDALRTAGVEVECITAPFRWYPATRLAESMLVWQLLDLTEVSRRPIDRVIALRFPAYLVNHASKAVWLLHQHRTAYELYDTSFGDLATFPHGAAARETIQGADGRAFPAAQKVFAISHNVASRLKQGNGLDATVLYPPVPYAEAFHFESVGDYVLYASRLDGIKRHGLLVEAMTHTTSSTRCVLAGAGPEEPALRRRIEALGLENRVQLVGRVSNEELRSLYANALAVFYGPYDEDYGYGTLEAFLSAKSVITLEDSGGPLEFVEAGLNGLVVPPDPRSIARAIDALAGDKPMARRMGLHGRDRVLALDLSWSRVIDALLS